MLEWCLLFFYCVLFGGIVDVLILISCLERGSKLGLDRIDVEEYYLVIEDDIVVGNLMVDFWILS